MPRLICVMQCMVKRYLVCTISGFLLSIGLIFFPPVYAGNFAVSPIRLTFDAESNSGAITIRNEAEKDLNVQIRLYEWTQGEDGKDNYKESDDLLYFPRLAKIKAGESRVVRVGLRQATNELREKSYRLYVEELPGQKVHKGMALAVAVRFGVPIFSEPAEIAAAGSIEKIEMENGQLRLLVRNTGNIHFKITSIDFESGESYSDRIDGWYLLQGAQREYGVSVPDEQCAVLKRIEITVKTDVMELQDALTITPEMCRK